MQVFTFKIPMMAKIPAAVKKIPSIVANLSCLLEKFLLKITCTHKDYLWFLNFSNVTIVVVFFKNEECYFFSLKKKCQVEGVVRYFYNIYLRQRGNLSVMAWLDRNLFFS